MHSGRGIALGLALLLAATARADFEDTELSGAGAPPLKLAKGSSTHEALEGIPGLTYNVYRRHPDDTGFRCIHANRVNAGGWEGDPDAPPAGSAFWYTVTADDRYRETLHGSELPVIERCACSGPPPVPGAPGLRYALVASGLDEPVGMATAPGDRSRIFVVERGGDVRVVHAGRLLETPFLSLGDRVVAAGAEQGLLSLAFHPTYGENGRFYVAYTAAGGGAGGQVLVEEYRVSAEPDVADPASGRLVIDVPQPHISHNGGQLQFGPFDGYLYVGLGDGAPFGDREEHAQDLGSPLGSILRIDVDSGPPYGIPPDNPFVGVLDARPEIWAYGLRNPWRFSFDAVTRDLYIGDVGEACFEEIHVGALGGRGDNYGWSRIQGNGRCFDRSNFLDCDTPCDPRGTVRPVLTYGHDQGCSVIGGFVYRGCRLPGYHGTYFYADFCFGWVRSFRLVGGELTEGREWPSLATVQPTSFGIDERGELHVVSGDGALLRIVPE